jgi:hypothetical protein
MLIPTLKDTLRDCNFLATSLTTLQRSIRFLPNLPS